MHPQEGQVELRTQGGKGFYGLKLKTVFLKGSSSNNTLFLFLKLGGKQLSARTITSQKEKKHSAGKGRAQTIIIMFSLEPTDFN